MTRKTIPSGGTLAAYATLPSAFSVEFSYRACIACKHLGQARITNVVWDCCIPSAFRPLCLDLNRTMPPLPRRGRRLHSTSSAIHEGHSAGIFHTTHIAWNFGPTSPVQDRRLCWDALDCRCCRREPPFSYLAIPVAMSPALRHRHPAVLCLTQALHIPSTVTIGHAL